MIFEDMGRIINFHKVKDIKWFENVICLLKSKYTIINENQLIGYYYNKKPLPRKSCMITVDDGDMTSYTIIYPILKKHHVPAIFFVSPEKMVQSGKHRNFWFQEARHCDDSNALMEKIHSGNYPIDDIWGMIDSYQQEHNTEILHDQNMTLKEVREIDSEGLVAIGAHTMDHPFLARETDDRSKYEIEESIKELENLLGHPVLSFAYPNGTPTKDFGKREMETVSRTTCKVAFSTEAKNFSRKDNVYSIPRFGLSTGSPLFIHIKLMLGSHYATVKKLLNILKHV